MDTVAGLWTTIVPGGQTASPAEPALPLHDALRITADDGTVDCEHGGYSNLTALPCEAWQSGSLSKLNATAVMYTALDGQSSVGVFEANATEGCDWVDAEPGEYWSGAGGEG